MSRLQSAYHTIVRWLSGCRKRKDRLARLQEQRCLRELERKRTARAAARDYIALQSDA